jgi:hypothetical protein
LKRLIGNKGDGFMTQFQQVLAAIKALDGKGTPKEIYAKIREANPEWKTNTPVSSVRMYLSKNNIFKSEDGIWTLPEIKPQDTSQSSDKKSVSKPSERGLYFITLSSYINIHGAGFLFKIGQSGDVKKRLVAYSASLPIDTIQLISFYPIPNGVNLDEAEKEVNGELLGNENLGEGFFDHTITIRPYFGNHQDEWLQTLDITLSDTESLNKLANIIDSIVKATIETLTPKTKEEQADE